VQKQLLLSVHYCSANSLWSYASSLCSLVIGACAQHSTFSRIVSLHQYFVYSWCLDLFVYTHYSHSSALQQYTVHHPHNFSMKIDGVYSLMHIAQSDGCCLCPYHPSVLRHGSSYCCLYLSIELFHSIKYIDRISSSPLTPCVNIHAENLISRGVHTLLRLPSLFIAPHGLTVLRNGHSNNHLTQLDMYAKQPIVFFIPSNTSLLNVVLVSFSLSL